MRDQGAPHVVDRVLDRAVSATARVIATLGRASPTTASLSLLREEAAERAVASRRAALTGLAELFRDEQPDTPGITEAKNTLSRLAAEALVAMRDDVERAAAGPRAPIARLDRRWRETSTVELIDRVDFDERKRVRLMTHLDEMNVTIGAYGAFLDVLRPFLVRGRATRVLDLAAGHGGFLLEVAAIARREGLALELVASDIADEYLAIGRRHAEERDLPVTFVVQDALDTTNLAPGAYDLVVCTQSLHHFPPGLVAVLTHEALRIASRAVVLIDGARSKTNAALIPLLGIVRYRDLPFAHDSWVSLRKFFAPEELGLLARCGALASPGPERSVESRFLPPGHLAVVVRSGAQA
jgi:2-polyprenyl-3-methyl-5-hydroxy-6-metoxy-1,4-benzoquinol methylase